MNERDVAVVLTPGGMGAIAVIRLRGAGVRPFVQRHFSRTAAEGRCVYGKIRDGSRVIDDAVVVLSEGGRVADINVHGGAWVVRSLLELAGRESFEIVENEPGQPLPEEAVDGSTPLAREVMRYLPLARTELAVRVLLAQEDAWQGLRDKAAPEQLRQMLADRSLHWLLHMPRVAIIGAPNVGKSTLANQLFATERSITADLPGTTRDWVGEVANIDGLAVMLVDTPGIRRTKDAVEGAAIERSSAEIRRADLVVLVLDPTRPLQEQRPLIDANPESRVVVNKADRPALWDMPGTPRTVATTGEGIDALQREIRRRFGCDEMEIALPRCWTQRQRDLIEAWLQGR